MALQEIEAEIDRVIILAIVDRDVLGIIDVELIVIDTDVGVAVGHVVCTRRCCRPCASAQHDTTQHESGQRNMNCSSHWY